MFQFKKYDFKYYNYSLFFLVVVLSCIGAFLVHLAQQQGEHLFTKQILGVVFGLLVLIFVSLIDYHFICEFYIILYIINFGLLLAVRLVGTSHNSSQRWLDLKVTEIQPSEFTKIIMILFMAKLFTMLQEKMNKFYVLILSGILMGIPTFLILIQTNLSTSMVLMFIFVMMIFAAGLSYKIIFPVLLIGIPTVMGLFWYIQQDYQVILTDYQHNRVMSFLNPELDTSADTMYQQDNSILVIGSGKLIGKLITDGVDSIESDTFVPISESDFIFSVAGESLGFIGGCVIILILAMLVFKCLMVARYAADRMGMLIALGIAAMFMFQVFVNIGVATKLLPNTGLPLPFVSYGLSSLLSCMIAVGLVINISLQRKNRRG